MNKTKTVLTVVGIGLVLGTGMAAYAHGGGGRKAFSSGDTYKLEDVSGDYDVHHLKKNRLEFSSGDKVCMPVSGDKLIKPDRKDKMPKAVSGDVPVMPNKDQEHMIDSGDKVASREAWKEELAKATDGMTEDEVRAYIAEQKESRKALKETESGDGITSKAPSESRPIKNNRKGDKEIESGDKMPVRKQNVKKVDNATTNV